MSKMVVATPLTISAITASSAVLSADNLKDRSPALKWRTTSYNSQYLEIDMGAAVKFNLIGLLHTNLSSAAVYRVRAATSQANLTASPGYDSGANQAAVFVPSPADDTVKTRSLFHFPAALQDYRWIRIDVDDGTANADGYIEAGVLLISRGFQPGIGCNISWEMDYQDASKQHKLRDQSRVIDRRERLRQIRCSLTSLTAAEVKQSARPIQRKVGNSGPLLVLVDPAENEYRDDGVVWGIPARTPTIRGASVNTYVMDLVVDELPVGELVT